MAHFSERIFATATEERPNELNRAMEQANVVGHYGEGFGPSKSFCSERDLSFNQPNLYAPNSHTGYSKGYENFPGEWDDFYLYGRNEGLNREPPGIYSHSAALGFNNGHGSSFPVTPSLSVVGNCAQQYATSGSGADYTSSLSAYGRGSLARSPGGVSFQDQLFGHREFRSDVLLSDWLNSSDSHRPLTPASQQPRQFCGFSSASISNKNTIYLQDANQISHPENDGYNFGTTGGGWNGLHYSRQHGMGNGSFCSCCSASDTLNEQNRGPSASKTRRQIFTEKYWRFDNNRNTSSPGKMHDALNNSPDFSIKYEYAKFFVIKSYSEDNIHKSIKYGVWASTPNGNQKLNTAYIEAKEKLSSYPIFLFFSVNASAQFCGVAEMVGPVDFEKSVDYWQQDKWSGQFPVKWHVVKDVPNSQFRHILLENNDNKPVTNSRDTQEVKLEKGVEMLNIFRNYETNISILDDFDYYENQQKSTQELKSKDHNSSSGIRIVGGTEKTNVATMHYKFIENMSESFAQVVQLKECSKGTSIPGRYGLRSDVPMSSREKSGSSKNGSFARPIDKLGYF